MSIMLRVVAVLAAVAAVAGGTGCSGPAASPSVASRREDPNVQPDDIMRQINCFRAHGLPNYPDPTYDPADGRWHFPDNQPALTPQVRQACASVMPENTPASPIPTAQLNDLLNFAKCMRAQGIANWPDPAVDGVFHPSNDLNKKGDPVLSAAERSCDHFLASSGGHYQVGPPNG